MTRRGILLWILLPAVAAALAGPVEIIELKHRPAEELIPVLQPHLWPGEALSGEGFRLLLSAPPPRAAALREIIRKLDTPPVPIRITLRLATREAVQKELRQGGIRLSTRPGETRLRGRLEVHSTRADTSAGDSWQVTGVAGQPVRIETGKDFPYPALGLLFQDGDEGMVSAQGLRYRSLRSGFHALVRLQGERVIVDIAPRREDLLAGPGGSVRHQSLRTRVTGRLGTWIDLGGDATVTRQSGQDILYRTESNRNDRRHFWIRVDRIER